jgi:murein DD-endopeptidase MepM/ murein hydrolase activator NlpD
MARTLAGALAAVLGLLLLGAPAVAGSLVTSPQAVVPGSVQTQGFGCSDLELEPFDPQCPSRHFHSGVDLAAPAGTPVLAAGPGVATVAYMEHGYGIYVAIQHDGRTATLYGHLSAAAVHSGDRVTRGARIGAVGATGLATGAHVHLEVRRDGRPVDPYLWLTPAHSEHGGDR